MVTGDGSICVASEVGAGALTHTGMLLGWDFHGLGAVVASDGSICAAGKAGAGAFTHTGAFLGGNFHRAGGRGGERGSPRRAMLWHSPPSAP